MTEKNRGCTIGSRSGTGFANERPNLEDKYGELTILTSIILGN